MSDTPDIDEKKNASSISAGDIFKNMFQFIITVIVLILIVTGYFTVGGLILYGCKIGQSNILPTEIDCFPYTDFKPEIQAVQSNIFITATDPPLSEKISFPYEKNSKNALLDFMRKYKGKPSSGFFLNYFISIIESLASFNFGCFNMVANGMNGAPELFIILLGPLLFPLFAVCMFILNNIYLIYLWFAKMEWFFKTNRNTSFEGQPIWESVTLWEPLSYGSAIFLVFLFFILFFVSLVLLWPTLATIGIHMPIIAILTTSCVLNNKEGSVLSVLKGLFKNYKVTIMTIISILVVISTFANIGAVPGLFCLLTLLLIYWGVLSLDIFKREVMDNLTPLVKSTQATKKCVVKDMGRRKHGFIYNLFFPQSGGNIQNVSKYLKSVGNKLKQHK